MKQIRNILGPQKCTYCRTGYLNKQGECNKCCHDESESQIDRALRKMENIHNEFGDED